MGPIYVHAVTINCLDAEAQAAFWGALLGVGVRGRWHEFVGLTPPSPGHPRLLFQQVDGPLPDERPTDAGTRAEDAHAHDGPTEAADDDPSPETPEAPETPDQGRREPVGAKGGGRAPGELMPPALSRICKPGRLSRWVRGPVVAAS
jgi:catechol 2,3-dioxygenase-like lactoylglutathione lyase family enzyme